MNNKKSSVPKLRFPEFTDAWEQRKLGKLADFNPRSNLPDEFKYVDLESVVGTELTGYRFENKLSAPSRAQRLAQKGDIFYQTVRPYQKNNYLFEFEDENFVFSTGYAQLRPLINGRFLFSKLQEDRFVQQVLDKCTGTSYPAINSSDLSEIKVYIPDNKQEQQKIGSFFTALDRLITTHQRKLENVKKLKKSLLQKMFPKSGQEFPEIRFPEFTDAWEQRKLGNVVEIIMGQSPSSEYYTDNPEDYILVQGNADIKNGKVFPRVWTTQITKMSKKNDLIMSVRAPVGDMAKTDYEVVLGRGVCAIRGDEFIYQLLNKMKIDGYWQTLSTGSTFESINSSDIKNAQIVISSQQEQQKIGSFFTALDRLITTHQRKLENVKNLKKALLQQMFV
ncbi:restriction endonuclease subunit S [Pasteurella multocida]|uniref:restriction endonuclease subunit S n=1 Tax=Pasteurella multocida TaxID=747 RepID=UPI00202599D9|nr:restriction endonuclease subunit S [Pasteurella multocida]URJ86585.1 restriction endonuclease subunit S [Pasteurella multocida]URJ88568.1 restriction endonuclease subunit S [Pasteurella multocida]